MSAEHIYVQRTVIDEQLEVDHVKGKITMRNLILLGAVGAALALGAAGANAQSILDRPQSSPYVLVQPLDAPPALSEGRSAFTSGFDATVDASGEVRGGPIKNNGQVPHLDVR